MNAPVFADSSALVKLYADEAEADGARSLPVLVVSQLARVEVPAALWRKHRTGELSAANASVLVADFEADYFGTDDEPPRFLVLALTAPLLDTAAHLVGVHGLRAYDSIQLASARAARDNGATGLVFAAFDKSLRDAAATEAFPLWPNHSTR